MRIEKLLITLLLQLYLPPDQFHLGQMLFKGRSTLWTFFREEKNIFLRHEITKKIGRVGKI